MNRLPVACLVLLSGFTVGYAQEATTTPATATTTATATPAAATAATATPAAAPAPAARLADFAWLAGHWRGTLANGAVFEAHYTGTDGGAIVSASKEVRNGRAVGFELELFFEKEGCVIYRPFPNGKRSEHDFPLISYETGDGGARAVFENKEHDFPQSFVFALASPEQLVITLAGPGKDGNIRRIQFDLRRVR